MTTGCAVKVRRPRHERGPAGHVTPRHTCTVTDGSAVDRYKPRSRDKKNIILGSRDTSTNWSRNMKIRGDKTRKGRFGLKWGCFSLSLSLSLSLFLYLFVSVRIRLSRLPSPPRPLPSLAYHAKPRGELPAPADAEYVPGLQAAQTEAPAQAGSRAGLRQMHDA